MAYRKLDKPTPQWMREKYEAEKLDCPQIARIVGCDAKTAWQWLQDAGISTRPRGDIRNLKIRAGTPSAFKNKKHNPSTIETIRQKAIARGTVPYLRNGQHWLKIPGSVNGRWKGGITPERQAFYRSPEWKLCARTVWARDNATCQRCSLNARSIPRPDVDFDLHHIDSFAVVERRADPENIVLLCEPCHYWIHGKQNTERLFLGRQQ